MRMQSKYSGDYPLSLGYLAKIQRFNHRLSREELAEKVEVSLGDVILLENNHPLPVEIKHKMLRCLWDGKANIFPR